MQVVNKKYILSCDIGGSHITSSIVEHSSWRIIDNTTTRNLINSNANAKTIFQSWAMNIQECIDKFNYDIDKIGIAMPGPFDYENGISLMNGQSKYDSIYKLNTTMGIQNSIGNPSLQIKYINDAAAFLQGEVFASNREEENCILGITLGTGLGSAVKQRDSRAFDAHLWDSPYGTAFFEEYLVTRWLTKKFYDLTKIKEKGLKEIINNHQNTQAFLKLMEEYRIHLYNFLTYFSEKYHCQTFIIGGNISKAWVYIDDNKTFNSFNITIAQYGEKAALIGAASLF